MDAINTNGKDAVRLCEHIVRHAFGDVVGRVASTLLNRGRCSAATVYRLAGISKQTANAALLILIQHNLVGSTGASHRDLPEEDMYEFDISECLLRLRWPRILALTEQNYGDEALAVVRQLLIYGKLTMPEILTVSNATADRQKTLSLRKTVVLLLRRGYIEPTCAELLVLRSDQIDRRYKAKLVEKSASAGTKLHSVNVLAELRRTAAHEIDEERKQFRDPSRALRQVTNKVGKKGSSSALKTKDKVDDLDFEVHDHIPVRVNYDKFNVLIRNELLVKAAEDRWNVAAAEVLRAVLKASIDHQKEPKEMRTEEGVGINKIVDQIPTSQHKMLMAGITGVGSKGIPEIVRQYLAVMSGDDLATDQTGSRFLSHSEHSSPVYWVEIENICTSLKESLLIELVRERIDDKAARVLAVVARAHYASETMVRDCAMIPLREARHILSELQKLSLIEIQEVPKTAAKGRNMFPGSDYHLWGIDLRKAYGFLLSGVYKTLANIVQRRSREMERRAGLLAKLDRPDLQGAIEQYLNAKDQTDLAELNNATTMLSLAETRTDLVVMMLRDLPGGVPPR
ncbi:RNA polymerase III subunit C82 [Vanrija albida]|uniref:DNA-directed RNA polymerase III subunit RPC3 n=1 Tax=Vanrija albida TaxID=181172 RepID=A0ABR3PYD9_9TREE